MNQQKSGRREIYVLNRQKSGSGDILNEQKRANDAATVAFVTLNLGSLEAAAWKQQLRSSSICTRRESESQDREICKQRIYK